MLQKLAGNAAVAGLLSGVIQRSPADDELAAQFEQVQRLAAAGDFTGLANLLGGLPRDRDLLLFKQLPRDAKLNVDLATRRFLPDARQGKLLSVANEVDAEVDRVAGVYANWYSALDAGKWPDALNALAACDFDDIRRFLREATKRPDAGTIFAELTKLAQDPRMHDEIAPWMAYVGTPDGPGPGAAKGLTSELTTDTFSDPVVTKVLADEKVDPRSLSTPKMLALHELECPGIHGMWAKLSWDDVRRDAAQRVLHPELVNQGQFPDCNSASVVAGMARSEPEAYARAVLTVWMNGKADGGKIVQELLEHDNIDPSKGRITGVADWMMISAMQNVENKFWDFDGTLHKEGDDADGGYDENIARGMTSAGAVAQKEYEANASTSATVAYLLTTYGTRLIVEVSCHADKIQPTKQTATQTIANGKIPAGKEDGHAVTLNQMTAGSNVSFSFDTWGSTYACTWSMTDWLDFTTGYTVAALDKGVVLT